MRQEESLGWLKPAEYLAHDGDDRGASGPRSGVRLKSFAPIDAKKNDLKVRRLLLFRSSAFFN